MSDLPTQESSLFQCELSATFDISDGLKPHRASDGTIVGLEDKEGNVYKPIIAFEKHIAEDSGFGFEDISSETELSGLGIDLLDYVKSEFTSLDSK